MKIKENKNVYVQPDCEVIQVKAESIIATSLSTQSDGDPDDFSYGGTL